MKPTARPATVSATTSSSSSAPKPCPASTRSGIGAPSSARPSCANAHATTGSVATSTPPSATSRAAASGTMTSQSATPMAVASSAPREYENSRQTKVRPSPGHASALTAAWPERRAASHSSGGTPSAAARPTLFQYSNGGRRRANSASAASQAGKTFVSKLQVHSTHGSERDAVDHRAPAARREPSERPAAGENRGVGERPVRLEPRVRGHQRPGDRERGERRPARRSSRAPRCRATAAACAPVAARRPRRTAPRRRGSARPPCPRRPLELRTAACGERRNHDRRGDADDDERSRVGKLDVPDRQPAAQPAARRNVGSTSACERWHGVG